MSEGLVSITGYSFISGGFLISSYYSVTASYVEGAWTTPDAILLVTFLKIKKSYFWVQDF